MKKIAQWYRSLLKNIQLQLFISFVSLPFLIQWGLPISMLTPISTLIFGPFLTCFLLISSLVFFLELFCLPNMPLIWCLERATTLWLMCLELEQKSWLIGFIKPPLIILCMIPCMALVIVHNKKVATVLQRITLLITFLIISCILLKLFPLYKNNKIEKIKCNNGEITLITHDATLTMIDPAFIASRPSYESFISYTLIPEIIQRTGNTHIDHLVVFKFNKRIIDALQFLSSKIVIKNIYLPSWNGKIPSFTWRSYAHLKKTLASNNGKIVPISFRKQLSIDQSCILFIEPNISTKRISYYDATYQKLCVNGIINNELFIL
ncbi:MAG TPA: hypothetical protein VLB80_04065 [Candidatus Babeliales bacterium]|nr:hypothetical protein [Candidatus Babeliales bacterium]